MTVDRIPHSKQILKAQKSAIIKYYTLYIHFALTTTITGISFMFFTMKVQSLRFWSVKGHQVNCGKLWVMIKVRPPCADNQLFAFLVYHLRPTEWTVSTWIGSFKDMEPSPLVVGVKHPSVVPTPTELLHIPTLHTDPRPYCCVQVYLKLVYLS